MDEIVKKKFWNFFLKLFAYLGNELTKKIDTLLLPRFLLYKMNILVFCYHYPLFLMDAMLNCNIFELSVLVFTFLVKRSVFFKIHIT